MTHLCILVLLPSSSAAQRPFREKQHEAQQQEEAAGLNSTWVQELTAVTSLIPELNAHTCTERRVSVNE